MRVFHKLTPILLVLFFILLTVKNRKSSKASGREEFEIPTDAGDSQVADNKELDADKDRTRYMMQKSKVETRTNKTKSRQEFEKPKNGGDSQGKFIPEDEQVVNNKKLDADKDMMQKRITETKTVEIKRPALISSDKILEMKADNYRKAIEFDNHLQDIKKAFADIVKLAGTIVNLNENSKIVLLSFVDEDNAMFANSWLCNTKYLDLHSSLIMVTYGKESKELLDENWPEVRKFPLEPTVPEKDLRHKALTPRKLQIINALLHGGINLLLFDVESVWFANPLPSFKADRDNDMLVNFATASHVNTGFLVLFVTEKTKFFWTSIYRKLRNFEVSLNKGNIGLEARYEALLHSMLISRFGGVTYRELPVVSYTEGMWYMLSQEERKKTRPIVIRNNFMTGFAKRIERAMKWKHWFTLRNGDCDDDRAQEVDYQ